MEKDSYYDYLYIKNDIYITMKQDETHNLISHIKLEKKQNYQDGDRVGTNYIYLDDTLIEKVPIYAKKQDKKEKTIFDKIRKWLK